MLATGGSALMAIEAYPKASEGERLDRYNSRAYVRVQERDAALWVSVRARSLGAMEAGYTY